MKSQIKQMAVVLAGVFVVSLAQAQTAPGTGKVTFNGELLDNTCTINGGDADQTVELPHVSASSLPTAGAIAGSRMFQIRVENCSADTQNIAAHFETFNIDAPSGNASNVAVAKDGKQPAKSVTVQILDSDGTTAIKLGNTGKYIAVTGEGQARGAQLSYGGQYYATAAATPGLVMAVVKYTIAYN